VRVEANGRNPLGDKPCVLSCRDALSPPTSADEHKVAGLFGAGSHVLTPGASVVTDPQQVWMDLAYAGGLYKIGSVPATNFSRFDSGLNWVL
jgi:hypothetical protein